MIERIIAPDWKTILNAATKKTQAVIPPILTQLNISQENNISKEDAEKVAEKVKDYVSDDADKAVLKLLNFLIDTF